MLTGDDVKRLSFNVEEEFQELDTRAEINDALVKQYEILDKDFDTNNINSSVTAALDTPELKDIIANSFSDLGDKYKIPAAFKDIAEITNHLGDYSEKDSEFAKLYVSKLINAVTDAVRVKTVIALAYLSNRSISLAMQRATDPNISDLGETVAMIRELQDWMTKFGDLRDKYNIVGSDKLLQQMSDDQVKDDKPKLTNNALSDIISQINANARKAREEKDTDGHNS